MSGSGIKPRGEEAGQALLQLLDAYGADPARWPAEDPRRAKAWALIDSGDAMAAQSVAAARALDRALDTMAATGSIGRADRRHPAGGAEARTGLSELGRPAPETCPLETGGRAGLRRAPGDHGGDLVAGAGGRHRRPADGRPGNRIRLAWRA